MNLGHKFALCYSVQTMLFSPNYTENMDKMDVSALKIGQSHTRKQSTLLHFRGKTPSSHHRAAPPVSYCAI